MHIAAAQGIGAARIADRVPGTMANAVCGQVSGLSLNGLSLNGLGAKGSDLLRP